MSSVEYEIQGLRDFAKESFAKCTPKDPITSIEKAHLLSEQVARKVIASYAQPERPIGRMDPIIGHIVIAVFEILSGYDMDIVAGWEKPALSGKKIQ